MAPTLARKNAFIYFVEEYEAEQIAYGRRISRKQALDECASGWGELDPDTRLRYCNMANPMLDLAGKPKEKTPPNMEWLDPITGEYGEKWFRYVRSGDELYYLKTEITDVQQLKCFSLYLVHFNYFCQPSLKKYVPAELALVEFNLAEGIKNVYSTLINPGSIPLGFANEAKRLSQEGHGIPVPPHNNGEKDMTKIVEAVKRFLKFGSDPTGKIPPLFTVTDNVLPAMHMLNDMVQYNEDQPVFTVYPAHRMFYWIKSRCSDFGRKGPGFLDESYALKEIERDCFRYVVEIACDFHKQSDSRFPMCSESITKRLAFIICDHCCRHLDITLVGGKHVHKRSGDSSEKELQADGKEPENGDEVEGAAAFEETDQDCNCEIPEFIGGYDTREIPKDGFVGLNLEEIRMFYNAFMHNVMNEKVKFDFEKKNRGRTYMKSTRVQLLVNPFALPHASGRGRALPTSPDEEGPCRRHESRRSILTARIKPREGSESREFFEKKIAEVVKAKAEGKEVRVVHEADQ